MLRPRTTIVGSDGDYQQAIVQPGYAVSLGVGPQGQETVLERFVGVEQFLATHVLVACRNVAFLDVKFACPAWQGVFIVADQGVLAFDQVPGKGAATKGIHFIPGQMTPPSANQLPRWARAAAGQERKTAVVHLVEMKDALQARDQGKYARQQTALQGAVVVAEASLGDRK